jgi:RNA polymerase primary sigma factor
MDLMQEPVSLETPFGKDGGRLEDFMESEASESVRVDLHRNMDLVKKTRDLLSALPPREAQILRLRYGIDEPWSHTLQEIGKRVGISRERVRQIEDRALKRLKTPPFIAQVEACESIR